jgi:hypothetical protein
MTCRRAARCTTTSRSGAMTTPTRPFTTCCAGTRGRAGAARPTRPWWCWTPRACTRRRRSRPARPGRTRQEGTSPDPGRHLLDKIDAREQALAREAERAQAQVEELTARLRELSEAISDLQVTRKALISLAGHDEPAAEPAGPSPALPEHPAYLQILDAFADLHRPLRARDLCTALDLPMVARNTEGIRSELKRLVSRGILVETEPGLFTQPRP